MIWHWDIPGRETLLQARDAKVYLASANGVSETGELVNIDGTGNRVSQTLYGPEKIYFIVGNWKCFDYWNVDYDSAGKACNTKSCK